MPRKVVVKKERSVHTYAELWHASNCVLNAGVEQPKGSSWQFLSSAVLTAFAFEAYLNHVGPRTIRCWEQLERLPPWSKFELLCETLNVRFPDGLGARPLQTIVKLLDFRNTIAHGRSLEIKTKPVHRDVNKKLDAYLGERLLADWEQQIQTSDFAVRAREDVQASLVVLHEARIDNKEDLFTLGSGYYGATLADL